MRANKISPIQIFSITLSSVLGITILTIQQDIVKIAKQDAWLSMLLGGILSTILALLVPYQLAKLYPKEDYSEIALILFGKYLGRVVLVFFTFYSIGVIGLSLRVFVQTIKLFLLDATPNYVLTIFFIWGVVFVVKRGINTIAGSIDFMLPIYMLPLILLIVLPYSQLEMENIRPVLYQNTGNIAKAVLPAFTALIGHGAFVYFHKHCISIKNAFKWYAGAMVVSTILYTALTVVTILVFGPEEIDRLLFPTLILSKAVEFPITLLERLEAIILVVWLPGFFAWTMIFTYIAARNISVLFAFNQRFYQYTLYTLIPVVSTIALLPENILETYDYINIARYSSIFMGLVLAPFTAIYAYIKRRRKSG